MTDCQLQLVLAVVLHMPFMHAAAPHDEHKTQLQQYLSIGNVNGIWRTSACLWVMPHLTRLQTDVECHTAGSGGRQELASQTGAANLQRLIKGGHVQVFYPFVALYMMASYLQGGIGTSSMGLLSNVRQWLWIPVFQTAYRRAISVSSPHACISFARPGSHLFTA